MTRVVALVAVLISVAAPALCAQQVIFAANAGATLDSASVAAISSEIARARDRGIPVGPLIAKAREGTEKRAKGALIRTAVAKLAERLDSARVALGSASTTSELVAGAEALRAGAGAAALRSVRAATTREVAVPLGTLAQLLLSGLSQPRAVEMIVSLLHRNAAAAVVALGNQVERDVASGLRADESAIIRLRGIEGSLGFGDKVEVSSPSTGVGVAPPNPRPAKPQRRP